MTGETGRRGRGGSAHPAAPGLDRAPSPPASSGERDDVVERSADRARLERMARRMRRINVPMRFILGLPFRTPLSGRLMLLSHIGRKTGRRYRQPVSYVRDGDTLLTPGGGKWKLNLREGEPVSVRLKGRDVVVRPEFIRDADEVEPVLRFMMARNPRLTSFVPFVERNGTIDRTKLETALRHGFAIIRWHLESGLQGPRTESRRGPRA